MTKRLEVGTDNEIVDAIDNFLSQLGLEFEWDEATLVAGSMVVELALAFKTGYFAGLADVQQYLNMKDLYAKGEI